MAFKLILTAEAQQDIDDAIQWYEEQQAGLGIRFYLNVEQTLDKITLHPTHYSFLLNNYRFVALSTFPFQIIFSIKENELLLVLAVWHTSLNPGRLIKRLQ